MSSLKLLLLQRYLEVVGGERGKAEGEGGGGGGDRGGGTMPTHSSPQVWRGGLNPGRRVRGRRGFRRPASLYINNQFYFIYSDCQGYRNKRTHTHTHRVTKDGHTEEATLFNDDVIRRGERN